MSARLYLAPAAGGKTAYLVQRAHALAIDAAAGGPASMVRVVVPTFLQARAWRRRLAEAGGALGVRVGTFDALYRQVLREADQVYTRLSEPIQYRLLRLLAADRELDHYRPLRAAPGFIRVVLDLIRELKAGGVFPEDLIHAIDHMGNEPRLREIADLYDAYQRHLQGKLWADAAGIGWLAQEALRDRRDVAAGWPCVMVDGFDDLTSVQLAVLRELSQREGELLIALTGTLQDPPRRQAHKRFNDTRQRIEQELGIAARPLPTSPGLSPPARTPPLAHLEATLYAGETSQVPAGGCVVLVAAPDREGEVRAALRWLKERLILDGVRPGEAALLARSMDAYHAYVQQVADEYGLPAHAVGGMPLRHNPAVAALLDLLRLAAPATRPGERQAAYAWRGTVEAWRSPYLDWRRIGGGTPQDALALDWLARWGSVLGGLDQWREAFDLLIDALDGAGRPETRDEDLPPVSDALSSAEAARALRDKFERFVARITPPEGEQSCRTYVQWIERLIGEPTGGQAPAGGQAPDEDGPPADLGIVRAVLDGPPELVERDLEALSALKDILRGLVWAEGALDCRPTSFELFLDDLQGAVNAATYRLPLPVDQEKVWVASVAQARGVRFKAVALLGMAEGEFPTALVEDPFLRDVDRRRLRGDFGLDVAPTAESAEAAYFYEAVTRPSRWLLLARPRIADNGAPWQASPFWEETRRRVAVEPLELTSGSQPTPAEAASWPELLRAVGARTTCLPRAGAQGASIRPIAPHGTVAAASRAALERPPTEAERTEAARLWAWAIQQDPGRFAALESASRVLQHRATVEVSSAYDGDLTPWGATFARHFGPDHTWSASRLESYRTCPFDFFVGSVLRLEPRSAPAEGLDARQLGNLYHHILEGVYQRVDDAADLGQLLAALPRVAASILDEAPRREQFRATAWWEQTRQEIVDHVERSIRAMDHLRGEYVPCAYEQAFGIPDFPGPELVVTGPALDGTGPDGGDTFRMRGFIDRVDRAPDGRVRIIDYKTGGPASFTRRAFADGKKLQLPLYALAAREALGLGEIADGYYWHVRHAAWHLEKADSSTWVSLRKMDVEKAIKVALGYVWDTLRDVRAGRFAPRPPDDGCPDYCPAAAFCWHYEGRGW